MNKANIPAKDRIGQKVNMLTILEVFYRPRKSDGVKEACGVCKCDCGVVKTLPLNSIIGKGKKTKSCGCLPTGEKKGKDASNYRHGMTKTKAWKLWSSMKRRCQTPSASGYYKYGAKGITVCDRWSDSFEAFLEDMGEPEPNMSIDRIDNDKGYEPSNCRWATVKEQARNKTSNMFLIVDGQSKSLAEWVEIYFPIHGIKYATVQNRIYRGWDAKTALTTQKLDPKKPELYLKKSSRVYKKSVNSLTSQEP